MFKINDVSFIIRKNTFKHLDKKIFLIVYREKDYEILYGMKKNALKCSP